MQNRQINELISELNYLKKINYNIDDEWNALSNIFYRFISIVSNVKGLAFHNFYSRFRFVLANLPLTKEEIDNFDALRRFIRENDNINKKDIIETQNFLFYVLNRYVNPKYKFNFINNYFTKKYFIDFNTKEITIVSQSKSKILSNGNQNYFIIKGVFRDKLSKHISIQLIDFPHTNFTYLHKLIDKDMIISFQDINVNDIDIPSYKTNYNTKISINPDFLIDASGVAECFQFDWNLHRNVDNSKLFIFSKLFNNISGDAALKGSIVGNTLDEFIKGNKNFNSIFDNYLFNYPLRVAQFNNEKLDEIKLSIKNEHLPNIENFTENQLNKKNNIWIEPTYFSTDFGLQGRLDVLSINNNSKNITELKSGTPSNPNYSIAWPSHYYQVVCYDLLLKSTYGNNRQGNNQIFYSKHPTQPLRNIVSQNTEQQLVIKVRNQIMDHINELANNNFTILEEISENGVSFLPKFSISELDNFKKIYRIGETATKYYNELLSFTLRELITAKTGNNQNIDYERTDNGFASLWLDSQKSKENRYSIIHSLIIENINNEEAIITLNFTKKNIAHSFRKRDLVILYPLINNKVDTLTQHILKGSIKEISNLKIEISLFNKQTDYSFFKDYKLWNIEKDIFEQNYWSTISNLINILEINEEKLKLILGEVKPKFSNEIRYNKAYLTDNQNEVIEKALNSKDYFILQGPPGTGKTSTFLINYITEELKINNNPIIVLAFTNKAVDKICENFRNPRNNKKINYIRIGSKGTEDEFFFNNLIKNNPIPNPDKWKNLLKNTNVIVSTIATFQNKAKLLQSFIKFQEIIIDEASQLTEASLAGIVSQFNKFILIGDQKQLPAVITQEEKECNVKDNTLHKYGIIDHRISFFERLFYNSEKNGWLYSIGQLTTHYRMHSKISSLISRHYKKELIAGLSKQNIPINYNLYIDGFNKNFGSFRNIFIETQKDPISKKNTEEAKLISELIAKFVNNKIYKPNEIGVITPFRAQITEIKKYLGDKNYEEVIIDTVERFQGDEKKVIIFSSTASNTSQLKMMQSIAINDKDNTDRKLLVSISRASEQFIMLGNSAILKTSNDYKFVIDKIKHEGGYFVRKRENVKNVINKESNNNLKKKFSYGIIFLIIGVLIISLLLLLYFLN